MASVKRRSISMQQRVLFFFLLAGLVAASTATALSGGVFESQGSTGRNLLQAKKSCSINFEALNYTIITSQCKGPQYAPKLCCGAFKELACPYLQDLNDLASDCASTMFSYINLYGKYPPGLFASECREGKEGLECPPELQQKNQSTKSAGHMGRSLSFGAILITIFSIVFLL